MLWQWFMRVEVRVGLASGFFPSVGKAVDKERSFLEWLFIWFSDRTGSYVHCCSFLFHSKTRKWSYLLVVKSRIAFKKLYWQKELEALRILGSLWIRLCSLCWGVEQDKHFWKIILGFANAGSSAVPDAIVVSFVLGVFPKSLPVILEKDTRASKHILKAKPFSVWF